MGSCSGGSCSSCSSCSTGDGKDNNELPPGMLDRYDLDQSTANGVLVWMEILRCPDGPRVAEASLQVLARMCRITEGRKYAVIFGGPDLKPLYKRIFGCGVGTIYHVRDSCSECYDSNVYSITLCDIIDRTCPAAVAFASTDRGEQLAEKVSAMLSTELYSGCTGVDMDGISLKTEPASMNQFLVTKKKRFPQVCTVVKDSYPDPEDKEGQGTAIYWQTWKG